MKKVVVIGAGINGLVAANYLKKENYDVTLLEFKEHTGGACIRDSKVINEKNQITLNLEEKASLLLKNYLSQKLY